MTAPSRPLIVVPTYNEADNVETLFDGIAVHAPQADVLFVDDNSQDGTTDRIRNRLIQRPGKLGLGTAYVTAFKWALEREYDVIQEDVGSRGLRSDDPRMETAAATRLSRGSLPVVRLVDLRPAEDRGLGRRYPCHLHKVDG